MSANSTVEVLAVWKKSFSEVLFGMKAEYLRNPEPMRAAAKSAYAQFVGMGDSTRQQIGPTVAEIAIPELAPARWAEEDRLRVLSSIGQIGAMTLLEKFSEWDSELKG